MERHRYFVFVAVYMSLDLSHCPPSFTPFVLLSFSVPSVFPRNVTVQLNESWLLITWKPPPDDKINGILRGYDVIVRHGPLMTKVSMFYPNYPFIVNIHLLVTLLN